MWEWDEAEELKRRKRLQALSFQERMADVVRKLTDTRDGMDFLLFLLEESGVLKTQFPEGHAQAAWREGRRAIGLHLMIMAQNAGVIEKLFAQEEKNG